MTHAFKKAVLFAFVSMVAANASAADVKGIEQTLSEYCKFELGKGAIAPVAAVLVNFFVQNGMPHKAHTYKGVWTAAAAKNQFLGQFKGAQTKRAGQAEVKFTAEKVLNAETEIGSAFSGRDDIKTFADLKGKKGVTVEMGKDADKDKIVKVTIAKDTEFAKVEAISADVPSSGKMQTASAVVQDAVLLYALYNTFARGEVAAEEEGA